jgi:hypothetical protein
MLRRFEIPTSPTSRWNSVFAKDGQEQTRTLTVCSNITVAIAAWERAKKIFPNDKWLLT